MKMVCPVCGNDTFNYRDVLWPELIKYWQLSEGETAYINRQQGFSCSKCSNNLRAMALAQAILVSFEFSDCLAEFVNDHRFQQLRVLEINNAGMLTPLLEKLPFHRLIKYPEYDMMKMDIESGWYDLVVHSDTLEHIENPELALAECLRVLKPGGRCIFTVPIVLGRLTRSRKGLPRCYHGTSEEASNDFLVVTEFGSDMWTYLFKAGFYTCTVHCIEYPAGLAIEAKKQKERMNE